MDHADALELIELAAVEPDGLERLTAGDTTEGAAVAGHLAGCPSCVAALARVRRTAAIASRVIASAPDPALRERTLAYVRELGRDRSAGAQPVHVPESAAAAFAASPVPGPVPPPVVAAPPAAPVAIAARRSVQPAWTRYGAIAAALVLAAGLGFGAATVRSPERQLQYQVSVLQSTAQTTLRLESLPDSRRIALAATPAGGGASGTLLFSPSSGELVMVAEGLAPLASGQEYGCWIEVDGTKTRIGRMYPGGDLHAWAGPVPGLAALPANATFGVSLVPAGGGAGEPLLTGS